MIGIIAAVSPTGVIGVDNTLPWHYPADLKRFKRLTTGTSIIMGRLTWESLPRKPLPKRRNLVITSRQLERADGLETFESVEAALATVEGDAWFIGGARIFEEAMRLADTIDLTYVPDDISAPGAVYFPEIDGRDWEALGRHEHEDDPRLARQRFRRRS